MLPICSVCGQSCMDCNTGSDELGHVTGEWIHIVCRARSAGYYAGGGLTNLRIPFQKKAPMYNLRIPFGRVGASVCKTLQRLPVNYRKV